VYESVLAYASTKIRFQFLSSATANGGLVPSLMLIAVAAPTPVPKSFVRLFTSGTPIAYSPTPSLREHCSFKERQRESCARCKCVDKRFILSPRDVGAQHPNRNDPPLILDFKFSTVERKGLLSVVVNGLLKLCEVWLGSLANGLEAHTFKLVGERWTLSTPSIPYKACRRYLTHQVSHCLLTRPNTFDIACSLRSCFFFHPPAPRLTGRAAFHLYSS
jgi:hypothetical protein